MANQFEKDEYEMQLYDFTLRDFKEENFHFVNEQIEKAMQFMNELFCDMLKTIKPEMKDKIVDATKLIKVEIEKNCKENIDAVNAQIEELLSIPNNVVLPADKIHLAKCTESREELENECSQLIKIMDENALFISCLEKEYNSYAIKDLLDFEEDHIAKAEDFLNISCDVGIYLESLKKAQKFNE